jgi:hypothetical protein
MIRERQKSGFDVADQWVSLASLGARMSQLTSIQPVLCAVDGLTTFGKVSIENQITGFHAIHHR